MTLARGIERNCVLLLWALAGSLHAEPSPWPVLDTYCLTCHEGSEPKGGFDLAALRTHGSPSQWDRVYRAIDQDEMPPAEKKQLSAAERDALISGIAAAIRPVELQGLPDPGARVPRRLTRHEYNNTVRDLLGLDTDIFTFAERLNYSREYFDPRQDRMPAQVRVAARESGSLAPVLLPNASLPADTRAEHGFTNRGDHLDLSPLLLEKYLSLAREIAEAPDLLERSPVLRQVQRGELTSRAFLERAFRRPLTDAEAAPYRDLPLQAILASPNFLYLAEPADPTQGPVRNLTNAELATRLSYFLWSSLPDEKLRQANLQDPAVLEAETLRLLRSPRVKDFAESFAVQWLQLNRLLSAQPDPDRFARYYFGDMGKRTLSQDLMVEPILFFETVLVEDRSILEFIDSDWLYLNHLLLNLYGLDADRPAIEGAGRDARWFRVPLTSKQRGGLLTMGAILTQNSTPLRTSPVKRGSWIAETIFHRIPPSPPPAAGNLVMDDRAFFPQGLTVRHLLNQHLSDPSCAVCHERIDPMGYPLEHYNAIGQYRYNYDIGLEIDASGQVLGRPVNGAEELKAGILARKEEFTRAFVKHLYSYALGRALTAADDRAVREIAHQAEADGYRLKSIILGIVKSDAFRTARNW